MFKCRHFPFCGYWLQQFDNISQWQFSFLSRGSLSFTRLFCLTLRYICLLAFGVLYKLLVSPSLEFSQTPWSVLPHKGMVKELSIQSLAFVSVALLGFMSLGSSVLASKRFLSVIYRQISTTAICYLSQYFWLVWKPAAVVGTFPEPL